MVMSVHSKYRLYEISCSSSALSIERVHSKICIFSKASIFFSFLSIYLSIYKIYLSIHQSIYKIYLSIHPSIYIIYLSIHLPFYLSIYLSTYLSIFLFIFLSIPHHVNMKITLSLLLSEFHQKPSKLENLNKRNFSIISF